MSLLFVASLVLLLNVNFCLSQAPYEVSIRIKLNKNSPTPLHICNGVIIHQSLVLTTADCLLVQRQGEIISRPLNASNILIYAGTNNSLPSIIRGVKYYEIKDNFNSTTLENDIAALILNESLPNRSDINWIMIGEANVNQQCFATFTNIPSAESTVVHPYLTQNVLARDPSECNRLGNYTLAKRQDICSDYIIGQGVMCNLTELKLKKTWDRGTPLICNNKVAGLFSSTIIPKHPAAYTNMTCYQARQFNAYYTRLISPTLSNWIRQKLMNVTIESTRKPTVISPPYVVTVLSYTTPATHSSKKNSADTQNYKNTIITSIIFIFAKLLFVH